jgi:ADP-ribose pyrophosphatase YjhB (NUDIX family)
VRQRIAAGALVLDGERLLLVHHVRPDLFDFWVPPGGGVGGAEELPAAAAREVREETGLEVEIGALAYIDELIISETRQCKFWYIARMSGAPSISVAHDAAKAEHIVEAAFLSRAELTGKTVYPHVIRDAFWGHLREGFSQPRYLGVREAEVKYPAL